MVFAANVSHPYYPKSLHLPHYIPNDLSTEFIVGVFSAFSTVILALTWIYTGTKKTFSKYDRLKLCWFMMCGCIHIIVEGYYSIFNKTLAGDQFFLSQLWKEYATGDSRYVSSDTFTIIMETFMAFVEGPLCFVILTAFMTNKPYAHIFQLLISSGQLYGVILYFLTEYQDGFRHSIIWHPVYFWCYFIMRNSFWIIFPSVMIVDALSSAHKSYMTNSNSSSKKKLVKLNIYNSHSICICSLLA